MLLRGLLRFAFWIGAGLFLTAGAVAVAVIVFLVPQLPDTDALKDVRFQVPLRIYSADGKLMGEFGEKRRKPLALGEIPRPMLDAILASEDQHFYRHPGVDWRGLARAVWHIARTGKKGPGGSTITMQVARNFFLGREKTYLRKLNEILLALKIERELTKGEILELYVNKIFLGQRAYGIGAAAEAYYGASVADLTLPQMAMIAGLPQRPSAYNPIVNPAGAKARRDYVLGRMLAGGHISQEAYEAATRAPVTARLHDPVVELDAPYVAEMARAFVERWAGGARAYTEGFKAITTVDAGLQVAARSAIRRALVEYDERHGYRGPELSVPEAVAGGAPRWDALLADLPSLGGMQAALVLEVSKTDAKAYVRGHGEVVVPWERIAWARPYIDENRRGPKPKSVADVLEPGDVVRLNLVEDGGKEGWGLAQLPEVEGALVALDPRNGAILALEGGFDFFRSKFNRALQAERQPGSNFKPFIYAAALERGFTAASLINDAPVVFDDPSLEKAWRPENYSGKFFGPTRLRWALTKSRNLVSIRLLQAVGIEFTREYLGRFGFAVEELPRNLSLALGSGEVTPLEIARAYAVLANGGYGVEPFFVARIIDSQGATVFRANPPTVCAKCEAPATGTETGTGAAREVADGEPPAGELPVAPRVVSERNVYILDSILRDVIRRGTGRAARKLGREDIAGKTGTTNDQRDAWFSGFVPSLVTTTWVGFDKLAPLGRRETGGRAALPMWMAFMEEALRGVPVELQEQPDGVVAVRIDPDTGALADRGDPNAVFEIFRVENVPRETSGRTAAGATANGRGAPGIAEGTTERLF